MPFKALDEVIETIQTDYLDMPGLALTFWQAQRLWNLSEELCEVALLKLVRARFLMLTTSGRYVRRVQSPALAIGHSALRTVLGVGNRA